LCHFDQLIVIDAKWVEEYVRNYDSKESISLVNGRIIGIDEVNSFTESIAPSNLQIPIGEKILTNSSLEWRPSNKKKVEE